MSGEESVLSVRRDDAKAHASFGSDVRLPPLSCAINSIFLGVSSEVAANIEALSSLSALLFQSRLYS